MDVCLFHRIKWQRKNKEQSTVAMHPWFVFLFWGLAVDNHWWGLLLQSIKPVKCHQNIHNYGKLGLFVFFLTDEILLKKSKKIWRVKPTFCTDFLNLFTFLSLMDPSRRRMCLAADAFKGLNGKAVWFCADGRLGRQTDHTVCRRPQENTAY